MTIQTMLEVGDRFDIFARELGHGVAMFMIAGSTTSNPSFICKIYETGQLRLVDLADLVVYGNPGDANDTFIPPIPESWKKSQQKVNGSVKVAESKN